MASLVVFLYFVMNDIEFCVIYVLLNLLNFNLIGFRFHKKRKNNGEESPLRPRRGSNLRRGWGWVGILSPQRGTGQGRGAGK